MSRKKILTDDEIKEAKRLKEKENLSNREIAKIFEVGKTTIWDNIYKTKFRKREQKAYKKYQRCEKCGILHNADIQVINENIGNICLGCVINRLKDMFTSQQIADALKVELKVINKHWYRVMK